MEIERKESKYFIQNFFRNYSSRLARIFDTIRAGGATKVKKMLTTKLTNKN